MSLSPSLPPPPKPPAAPPSLVDPLVMFARLREMNKAKQRSGRESTILTQKLAAPEQTGAGY
jgi:hypothetical protein